MMRDIIGPVANAILREMISLARIGGEDREKPILVVEHVRSTDWASLTFVGQRHELDLRLEGEAGAVATALALIEAGLAESEIPLVRAFIAEISVAAGAGESTARPGFVARHLVVEALSIRD